MIAAEYIPTKEELFEQAEPFKDNIVRGEAHPLFWPSMESYDQKKLKDNSPGRTELGEGKSICMVLALLLKDQSV